jgi:6-pyruvoyl tetrahydropterin synthase/QueD family protein
MVRKVEIRKRVEIAAAHRQYGDPSKCGYLHGHNWTFIVRVSGPINELGYIVNFSDIKMIIEEMDHKVILYQKDPLVAYLRNANQKVYEVPLNPTCENLSVFIADEIEHRFPGVSASVSVIENTNSFAEGHYEDNRDLSVDPR